METKIETQRLILRPVAMSDAQDIFEYAKDYDTGPRAGWSPHKTIEDTKEIINLWLSPQSTEDQFVIMLKQTGKVIGTSGITHLNKHIKTSKNYVAVQMIEEGKTVWEIGITISKQYWGKGIATEVIGALIDYLFKQRNADVVMATHSDLNIGSERAQEKNNLKLVGEYDSGKMWYNTNSTIHKVRIKTKEDWKKENIQVQK